MHSPVPNHTRSRYGEHRLSNGKTIYIPPFSLNVVKHPRSNWNDIDVYDVDTVQKLPLGTILRIGNQWFAYAEFGATLAAGDLVQAEAPDADHDALAPVAASAGATEFEVTMPGSGTDDFIANEYAGGKVLAQVNGTPGYEYPIWEHTLGDLSTTDTMTVYLEPGSNLAVALAATDDLAFIKNPWKEVIESPTTLTGPIVGVCKAVQADGQFGWVGVKGPHAVLTDGTLVVGEPVVPSNGTAGAVEPWEIADTSALTLPLLGTVADVGGNGEFSLVNFNGLGLV